MNETRCRSCGKPTTRTLNDSSECCGEPCIVVAVKHGKIDGLMISGLKRGKSVDNDPAMGVKSRNTHL